MELVIKKHKKSIFISKYSVFENGKLIFTAKSKYISEPKQLDLFDKNNHEIGSILNENTIFPEFNIVFNGGFSSKCKGARIPYNFLTIKVPEGIIELHHQHGLRIAVFKNEEQIALIKRDRFHFLNASNYLILANSDISQEFLVLLCIGWDWTNNNGIEILPMNFGRFGFVKRKEIKDWKPIE